MKRAYLKAMLFYYDEGGFMIKSTYFSVTKQYDCKDLDPRDQKYMSPTVGEEAQADYCENVLGCKYSWGMDNLVPGCNPVDYTGQKQCKCCVPRSSGRCSYCYYQYLEYSIRTEL